MTIKKKTMEDIYCVIQEEVKAGKDVDDIHNILRTLFPRVRISDNRFRLWCNVANARIKKSCSSSRPPVS